MKILKKFYYAVFAIIIISAVLLVLTILPITGKYFKLMVVQSGSMEPTIKMGDVVVVKPAHSTGSGQANDYKIGDIITFGAQSKIETPVTHRIFNIKTVDGKPFYITKGDFNNGPDQKEISREQIIGKVVLTIPYFGYAVNLARKPLGFMTLITVPAAVIIYDEAKKIKKEIAKAKNKK